MAIHYKDTHPPVTAEELLKIPEEMKAASRWICWGSDKIPVSVTAANNGKHFGINVTDQNNWGTFDQASAAIGADAYIKSADEYFHIVGVGFVVGDGWFCADLDGGPGHNKEDVPEEVAEDALSSLGTYTEKSLSGCGYHIFGKCDFSTANAESNKPHRGPDGKPVPDSYEVEFFTRRKFIAITGRAVPGSSGSAVDCSAAAMDFYTRYILTDWNMDEAKRRAERSSVAANISINMDDAKQMFLLNYPEILAASDSSNFKRGGPGVRLAPGEYSWIGAVKAMQEIGIPECDIIEWCRRGSNFKSEKDVQKVLNQSGKPGAASVAGIIADATANGWRPDPNKLTGEYKRNHEEKVKREEEKKHTADSSNLPENVHLADPAAAAPAASKSKNKKTYKTMVLSLIEAAKIKQFGTALYRIADGKHYKLLGDIFINHELIAVRGMDPEKQKAAQTMIRALQKDEYINYDRFYVGFKNGIMNWRTGDFLPYENNDIPIFRYFDVNYRPDADTSFVDGIITDWCQHDDVKKQMLYEMAGCCVYSDKPIKKWWSIEGKADTGKTTFLSMLRMLFGEDNVGSTPIQKLSDSNAIAELIDKPVNIVDDGSSKFTTDLSNLRRVIQGDKMQVKLLYQNMFSARLESRMIFVFNQIPRFRDDNDATAKKMLVIRFNRVYSDAEKDIRLIDKLTTEENIEAFLKLAIDAMKEVLNRNLTFTISEESRQITAQIMEDSDQFLSFTADIISDDYDWTMFLDGKRTKDVYHDFHMWAEDEGYKNILIQREFTKRCLKESGASTRKSHGNVFYCFK